MPPDRKLIRAIRFHHLIQLAVVVLSLWAAVDNEQETKRHRDAQLDATATAAASQHVVPILDLYFLKLLPAAPTFKNFASLEAALKGIPLTQQSLLERASPGFARQYELAVANFSELQRIARVILAESATYGDRYPNELVVWANRTLELKEGDLPQLMEDTEFGRNYAHLTGSSVGFSMGAARKANDQLSK